MTKHNKFTEKKHGGGKKPKESKSKQDNAEEKRRSYEHHDHCHKVQKAPTHTVPVKPSKYDELGDMLAAEEIAHKKERHQHHHHNVHHGPHPHVNQPGLAH